MLSLIPLKGWLGLGLLLVLASAFGVYKYQVYMIDKLETERVAFKAEISSLRTNITGVKTLVTTYSANQTKDTIEREKLQASTSRIDKIIKAKPSLVAKRIKSSYSKFHLEKACYSGNQEACNELKKD